MEEILNKILDQVGSIDKRFDAMDNRFESMENRMINLEAGQHSLQSEQSEMRKEMAFYYGSLMRKLDETKSELSSEIKHVSNVQKQHQDVLEILNEKQQ
jgi:chromosome segregation ATPase